MSYLVNHFDKQFDFAQAPWFRKTARLHISQVRRAIPNEQLENLHPHEDGTFFKQNDIIAKENDIMIRRTHHDAYTVTEEKFWRIYARDPSDPSYYVPLNFGRALFLEKDTVVITSSGNQHFIKAGGVVFQGFCNEVYGNQAYSFREDFARQAADNDLMPLTATLETQLDWARLKSETLHIDDILTRMAFEKRDANPAPSRAPAP